MQLLPLSGLGTLLGLSLHSRSCRSLLKPYFHMVAWSENLLVKKHDHLLKNLRDQLLHHLLQERDPITVMTLNLHSRGKVLSTQT